MNRDVNVSTSGRQLLLEWSGVLGAGGPGSGGGILACISGLCAHIGQWSPHWCPHRPVVHTLLTGHWTPRNQAGWGRTTAHITTLCSLNHGLLPSLSHQIFPLCSVHILFYGSTIHIHSHWQYTIYKEEAYFRTKLSEKHHFPLINEHPLIKI